MRAAAIDIGTNTVLLCIARANRRWTRGARLERATITRLGAGVDRTRELAPKRARAHCAVSRATRARSARRWRGPSRRGGHERAARRRGERALPRPTPSASSVSRPRVIGGEEEARLSFVGATSGLDLAGRVHGVRHRRRQHRDRPWSGRDARQSRAWVSLDIGSVRLFERHACDDPPSPEQLAAVRSSIVEALAKVAFAEHGSLVGVAGTVTTLAAIARGVSIHASGVVHGDRLTASEVEAHRPAPRADAARRARRARGSRSRPSRRDRRRALCCADAIMRWAGAPSSSSPIVECAGACWSSCSAPADPALSVQAWSVRWGPRTCNNGLTGAVEMTRVPRLATPNLVMVGRHFCWNECLARSVRDQLMFGHAPNRRQRPQAKLGS